MYLNHSREIDCNVGIFVKIVMGSAVKWLFEIKSVFNFKFEIEGHIDFNLLKHMSK